jgi:hypothetical protein
MLSKIVAAIVGTAMVGSGAYAATNWVVGLNTGSSGQSQSATIANLTISAVASPAATNLLYPGANGDVVATITNPNAYPVTIAGASTMTLVGSSSSTTFTIGDLTSSGGFVVSSSYESTGQTSTAAGTLSLGNSNKTVTFTVTGSPTNAGKLKVGTASTFTFTPLATIQDVNGDSASTGYSQSPALQIF